MVTPTACVGPQIRACGAPPGGADLRNTPYRPHAGPGLGRVPENPSDCGAIYRGFTLDARRAEVAQPLARVHRSPSAAYRAAPPSRFSLRLGTNFTALLVPVSLLLDRFSILP